MAIFGAQDASRASFFDGIYDVVCTCPNFYRKTCNIKNLQKITKKQISCWKRPMPQTDPSQGPFLMVFAMFYYAHRALIKKEPLFLPGGGRRHFARPLIAKAVQYARHQMPCASPDLKQAGACGRRPGQVSRKGVSFFKSHCKKPLKKVAHKIGFELQPQQNP